MTDPEEYIYELNVEEVKSLGDVRLVLGKIGIYFKEDAIEGIEHLVSRRPFAKPVGDDVAFSGEDAEDAEIEEVGEGSEETS